MKLNKTFRSYPYIPGISLAYFQEETGIETRQAGVLESATDKKVNKNSLFHACSMTKMVTAVSVLKLAQEGFLELETNVNEYLTSWKIPENEFTAIKKVTLGDLLSHLSGIEDTEGSFNPCLSTETISPFDIVTGTTAYHAGPVNVKTLPGSGFNYSDCGYSVIALLIEDVMGFSLPQLAQQLIFTPLNLKHTFFWDTSNSVDLENWASGHNKRGEIVPNKRACYPNLEGAGLWTTAKDFAKLMQELVKAFHGESEKVLNRKSAQKLFSSVKGFKYAGLGVFLENDLAYTQGWGVGMQCKAVMDLEKRRGMVVLTNSDPGMDQDEGLIAELFQSWNKEGKFT